MSVKSNSKKIVVFDKYILSQKLESKSQNFDVEVWKGRHRKSNQPVIVYIFLKKLNKEVVNQIKKWITLSSYETSASCIVRYLEYIITKYKNQNLEAVIVKKVTTVPFMSEIKDTLTLPEKVNQFHHLVRSMYFIHGTGTFHGNLSSSSIVLDYTTQKLKIWKDPLEIVSDPFQDSDESRAKEYENCGKIFLELFNIPYDNPRRRVTKCFDYIDSILDCYLEKDSRKRLETASPSNIYKILKNSLSGIKEDYSKRPLSSQTKMVLLVSIFRDFDFSLPTPSTINSLLLYLRDMLPQIKMESIRNLSRQKLKIIAQLQGLTTPSTSELFIKNVLLCHTIISDIYSFDNTKHIISFIKDNYNNESKMSFLEEQCKKSNHKDLNPIGDIGNLEEFRIWYREKYFSTNNKKDALIHNRLIKTIIFSDEWFYESSGIGWKDLILE